MKFLLFFCLFLVVVLCKKKRRRKYAKPFRGKFHWNHGRKFKRRRKCKRGYSCQKKKCRIGYQPQKDLSCQYKKCKGWSGRQKCCKCICLDGKVFRKRLCVKQFTDLKSWNDAKLSCENWGGNLAKIRSKRKNLWIKKKFIHVKTWFGLSDIEEETKWKWIDGKILKDNQYNNWYPGTGEPNNLNNEDCAQLGRFPQSQYPDGGFEFWNDEDCSNQLSYLCEKRVK